MRLKYITIVLAIAIFLLPTQLAFADSGNHGSQEETHDHSNAVDTKEEIKEYVLHHLDDTHHFGIWEHTLGGGSLSFPLPVILWDEGLHIFSSSRFQNHDSHAYNAIAESKGKFYKLDHGKVYNTDALGAINYNDAHQATNSKPIDFSITKNVAMIILTGLLMLLIFGSLAKSYAKNGGIAKGVGRFLEPIVLYIRDDIAIGNIGEKKYKRYMPYLLTVFFFIWFLNIFGLTPLASNVTGNIAVTFSLAVITFLMTNLTGTKDYWRHIFDPLGDSMPWIAKIPLYIILIPIELLGILIKPFSLLIRLYANIQAGHIVLMSLLGLMVVFHNWVGSSLSFVLAFAISLIEILVALLQAYIFTMLSALYFGFASEEHDHHEESHAH